MANTSIPRFFVKFMPPVFTSGVTCRRRNETGAFRDSGLVLARRIRHHRAMKRLLFFIVATAFPCALLASNSLPFPVSIGGQTAKDGTPFAKIEKPVAADAELSVE